MEVQGEFSLDLHIGGHGRIRRIMEIMDVPRLPEFPGLLFTRATEMEYYLYYPPMSDATGGKVAA